MQDYELRDPIFHITKEAQKLFDDLKKHREFKHFDNKDFCILVLILGYSRNKKKPLDKTKRIQWTRERYLSEQDKDILRVVAITEENDIMNIKNIQKIIAISEEYANGGIIYLKELFYDNPADFIKVFASDLRKFSEQSF